MEYGIIFAEIMRHSDYRVRYIDEIVDLYLSTFGAVCIEGPKWCGKTWTSQAHAKSAYLVGDPADNFANRELARLDVSQTLKGEAPHLIDEWQEVPAIWDAVRHAVDQAGEPGRYVLTGSSTPQNKGVLHSGTGRIALLPMHPMCLAESGDSDGLVSMADVCAGNPIGIQAGRSPTVEELIGLIIRGGWPGSIGKSSRQAALIPRQYVENVVKIDVNKVDGIERDAVKIRKCLRSLARNESTTAATATIRDDIAETDDTSLSINTVTDYLSVFKRMFLTNDIGPFSTFLRSPIRIKQSVKRHFCDPSIAAALLGASEAMLLRDAKTRGFLFESMALRDLQIYAEALGGKLYHYQDYDNDEIDAVIQLEDDEWCAFEIKMNPQDVDEAAAGLIEISKKFVRKPPRALAVVVGKSGIARRRDDGVYVLPLTMLRK